MTSARRAISDGKSSLCNLARSARQDVYVVGLEYTAKIGLVRRSGAQPLERRLLVAESFKAAPANCELACSISAAFNSSP